MAEKNDTAQQILARLYRDAAEVYQRYTKADAKPGLNRLEGFDPLVYMLLGACSSEFEKVNNEIHSSWSRMLEHIASLLTPEVHTGVVPAHGVVHARSSMGIVQTNREEDPLRLPAYKGQSIFFSPSGTLPICDADVKYMAAGNSLIELEDVLHKREILRAYPGKNLPPFTLWLGLELTPGEQLPDPLRLFFNWSGKGNQYGPDELLLTSKWSCNGLPLSFSLGLQEQADAFAAEFHLVRKLERQTNLFYQDRFLSLQGYDPQQLQAVPFPQEFREVFHPEDLGKELADPIVWIKAEFSPAFFRDQYHAAEELKTAHCLLNCFPVLNRRLYSQSFSLNENINLYPLKFSGHFLGMENVVSSRLQTAYQETPFIQLFEHASGTSKEEFKTYSLRKEGINRFDYRNARDIIDNTLRYLREEAFMFEAMGKNVLKSNISTIHKAINDIENRLRSGDPVDVEGSENVVFIGFPPSRNEMVVVRYWASEGFPANYIPSGSQLELYGRSAWQREGVMLVTEVKGGKDPQREMDRVHAYKSALVARERIVTEEDIRMYCFAELGGQLEKVEVGQGIDRSPHAKNGFVRTLEVRLELANTADDQHEHLDFITQKLNHELNEHAATILPIRVVIQRNKTQR